jgi:glutamyl-tRNA reductase
MVVNVVGVSYKEMEVGLREQLAWTQTKRMEYQIHLHQSVGGNVLLSTCNRFELYYTGHKTDVHDVIEGIIEQLDQEDASVFRERLWVLTGDAAITHLLKVTAGLDSMVLGEDQILSQVKDAWTLASKMGICNKVLNRLFQESIRFSKEIRTRVGISNLPISVAYLAYKRAMDFLNTTGGKGVMIVGLGETGRLVKKYFDEVASKEGLLIFKTSRSICQMNGVDPDDGTLPYEQRYAFLNQVDCIISATSSPHYIFSYDQILETMSFYHGEKRRQLFIDLAVPADVERRIDTIDHIQVLGIDEIGKTIEDNLEVRREMADRMAEKIPCEVASLKSWMKVSGAKGSQGTYSRVEEYGTRRA